MYDIFSLKDYSFPKDFLFGSGYAGHQVEGNNTNTQYWIDEVAGKKSEASGLACNSYEMYRDDIQLVSDLGHKAFRTSIEWSRIQPDPDTFDKEAADHYIRLFAELKENGIKTFCTIIHFTTPLWFTDKGGLNNADNRIYFEKYLEYIVPKVAPYVDFWNVLNEFNIMNQPNPIPPLLFHALGYRIIKKYSDKPVSTAHALIEYIPQRKYDKLDNLMCEYRDFCEHEFFFHAIRTGEVIFPRTDGFYDADVKGSCDFWSINLYSRTMQDGRKERRKGKVWDHKHLPMIDYENFFLEEFFPEGVIDVLTRLTDKPVYISENGVACKDDRFRIVWIATYLSALSEAIKLGIDVRGYLHWTLLDNYEWASYTPTFGLCEVDRTGDFKRTPKPSAYFYRDIIKNNGFNQEILRKYLTSMPSLDPTIK
ncbi:MAG: family 1 glycosylhydrolase [Monoglobales bacterium]